VEAFLFPLKAYKVIQVVGQKKYIFKGAIFQGESFVFSKDGNFFMFGL
jgi:hypothetical protein